MLSIGQVAQRAGLRPSALRYYEQVGLLPAPRRVSGRRQYGEDILLRLTVIRFARDNGFTLTQIRTLFAGRPYSSRLRQLATAKIDELETAIEQARRMQGLLRTALRCRCLTLEECGRRLSAKRGAPASEGSGR